MKVFQEISRAAHCRVPIYHRRVPRSRFESSIGSASFARVRHRWSSWIRDRQNGRLLRHTCDASRPISRHTSRGVSEGDPTRILIVDDEEGPRALLSRTLTAAGYEVEAASDGKMALALYFRRPHDLVLTDILMPGTDGLETILTIRAADPSARIIAMSGGGVVDSTSYLGDASAFGAVAVLYKPIAPDALLKAVDEALPIGGSDSTRPPAAPDGS